ncbi:hypothetical protein CNMCM8927_000228 [Aspergillus lentulus]|uniref:Uncharacterized protein n=1 Tax=Aspergillus lentulus TaxID=293939 RepID=A0AAN5YKS0_ASPLE|nr:hypothetical protein CNMCM8927_000228 [Aspergillus lentulus]
MADHLTKRATILPHQLFGVKEHPTQDSSTESVLPIQVKPSPKLAKTASPLQESTSHFDRFYMINQAGQGVFAVKGVCYLPPCVLKQCSGIKIADHQSLKPARHKNIISLLEYANIENEQYLVYKYEHVALSLGCVVGRMYFSEADIAMSNVDRLITIFNIEGCQHLEPEHRVAAVISQDILTRSLELSGVSQSALLNHVNPPHLVFQDDVRLICPYSQHRLKAAEAYGEAWWLVELYLDDIPPDALVQLREESAKSKDLKDGDVFRTYRLYKLLGNYAQERKWWARFGSDECRKTIRRLQQH